MRKSTLFWAAVVIFALTVVIGYLQKSKDATDSTDPLASKPDITYEYLLAHLEEPEFDGLDELLTITMTVEEVEREEGRRYTKIRHRFEFINETGRDITFYFHMVKSPEFTDRFYDIEQVVRYNREFEVIKAGGNMGTSLQTIVKKPEAKATEDVAVYNRYLKEFIGYFEVDGVPYIKKIH